MKNSIIIFILITLLFYPLTKITAQSRINYPKTMTFDNSFLTKFSAEQEEQPSFPQWLKDLRRFDIVSFGIFPIAMMFTGIFYDIYLNNNNNQIGLTGNYYQNTLLIAGSVSLTLAVTDIVIVIVKRNIQKRRTKIKGDTTYDIERTPYGEDEPDDIEDEASEGEVSGDSN